MLIEYEARKLTRDMKRELDAAPAMAAACGVGLLIIAALAIFGTRLEAHREIANGVNSGVKQAVTHRAGHASAAETGRLANGQQKRADLRDAAEGVRAAGDTGTSGPLVAGAAPSPSRPEYSLRGLPSRRDRSQTCRFG